MFTLTIDPIWFSGFLIGLFGSTHCVAMCGGIAAAITPVAHSNFPKRLKTSLAYNIGRISSYTIIGAFAGGLSVLLGELFDIPYWSTFLRSAAGLLLIGIGLHISVRWQGLKRLESCGMLLWKKIAPFAQALIPIQSQYDAFLLGILWGWLPCGLVYSVLATATASGSAINGACLMLFFGLGTLPAMISIGLFSMQLQRLLNNPTLKIFSGALIALLGLWTIAIVWIPNHSQHLHALP